MSEEDAYRMDRRTALQTGAAAVGSMMGLSGCLGPLSMEEEGGLEYHGDHYTLEREQSNELHVSNGELGPYAAYIAAGDEYLIEVTVENWDKDEVRANYDLLRIGDETIEEVDAAQDWVAERGEPSYPSTLFDANVPETTGLSLSAIDWDNGLGNDHDAYFEPADDEPFEQVHLKQL